MKKIGRQCTTFQFSSHAVQRMYERGISKKDTITAVKNGEIITEYPDDSPYPSYLLLARVNRRPIHVLLALDLKDHICYIITVYEPDPKIWSDDFKTRRPQ